MMELKPKCFKDLNISNQENLKLLEPDVGVEDELQSEFIGVFAFNTIKVISRSLQNSSTLAFNVRSEMTIIGAKPTFSLKFLQILESSYLSMNLNLGSTIIGLMKCLGCLGVVVTVCVPLAEPFPFV
ncbi:unnamed protein product [Ambrosiozyma monospora]|uniref:Unnamed protein product n=1 Tax=Ambrosiozyma monospora TaxID=43982 RepID=A0ACB5UCQ1_AMBMO|nr:unnamed protein product [Ambrosiozyma monospora]